MNRFGWTVLALFIGAAVVAIAGGHAPSGPREATQSVAAPVAQFWAIPVEGVRPSQLVDTWGQSRETGARVHQAIDIVAPAGTPVLAAAAGRVEKMFVSDRGGLTAYVRSPDQQWLAYYAHLSRYAQGLHEGQDVKQGQIIAFVGDTGNAGAGNYHLHFALAHMAPGERWWQGTPVNPYPLLAGRVPAR